jgi:hypothetical protein
MRAKGAVYVPQTLQSLGTPPLIRYQTDNQKARLKARK